MKFVKEILYEKFTDESDPIKDMGIGTRALLDKWMCSLYGKIYDTLSYTKDIEFIMAQCITHNKPAFVEYLLKKYNKRFNLQYKYRILAYAHKNNLNEITEIVYKHIRKKQNVNEKFTDESDPIKDMGIGIEELVKKYVKKEWNIDDIKKYRFGSSAGYNAILAKLAQADKIEIMSYLLKTGKVDPSDNDSLALRWAVPNGNLDMVKLLIKYKADINGYDAGSPLTCAIYNDKPHVVKYLLNLGVKIREVDIYNIKKYINDVAIIQQLKKLYDKQNKK